MIDLNEFAKISLNDLGNHFEIFYSSNYDTIVIDTENGYQLILYENKLVWHNIFQEIRLIANSLDSEHYVLWLDDHLIRKQDKNDFLNYINGKSAFPYNGQEIKIDKKYFSNKGGHIKYLKKKNLLAIFSWAQSFDEEYRSTTPCLTIWNLSNQKKVFEFYPDYGYWLTKLYVSENEDYLYIGLEWEWQDIYVFNTSDFSLVYKDGGTSNTGGYEACIHENKLLFLPTYCYDGWTGNFRYIDLSTNKLVNIFSCEEEPIHTYSLLKTYANYLLTLEDGCLKIFKLKELLLGKLISVPFEYWNESGALSSENIISYFHSEETLITLGGNKINIGQLKISNCKLNPDNMETNPQKLNGHWNEGWALDLHTSSSHPIQDEDGNITGWDTKRPPIAEELYRLKYWREQYRVDSIARPAAEFLNKYKNKWQLDVIIPIPPSDMTRKFQPVYEMAKSIGRLVGLPVDFNTLKKVKSTSQLKEIEDPDTRREILKDAFSINFNALSGKDVLIFDDLYRSGETLNAVCDVIMNKGKARGVYVLTITKTRSKR